MRLFNLLRNSCLIKFNRLRNPLNINVLAHLLIMLYSSAFIVKAGIDQYSPIEKIGIWLIERRIDLNNNSISCRASIPSTGAWFGERTRLNKDNDLIYSEGLNIIRDDETIIVSVVSALEKCKSDFLYMTFEK